MRYNFYGFLKIIFPYMITKFAIPWKSKTQLTWVFVNTNMLKSFFALLKYSSLFYKTFPIDTTGYDYYSSSLKINNKLYLLNIFFLANWNIKLGIVTPLSTFNFAFPASKFFPGLTWPERELSEMLQLNFFQKIDARRLLLDYAFDGAPLNKQFPSIGYEELEYDSRDRWLVYKPLKYRDYIYN